jgi:hypothetical protein
MVLGEEGTLFPSLHAYDKRVAGVISGAVLSVHLAENLTQ